MATVEVIGSEFERIHNNLIEVLGFIPEDRLYWKPFAGEKFIRVYSCAELIAHTGGIIEYSCNGILSNYWDDPFEWTLRESLPDRASIEQYLEETARVRRMAFEQLKDEDLPKKVFFPNHIPTTIGELLVKALSHASHHRGQIYAYVHLFSGERLPAILTRSTYDKMNDAG